MKKDPTIGIVVVTHNAKHHLKHCLPPLINSPLRPKILVMNSSSHDGTVEVAENLGVETFVIPRDEFNHGLSRERARKKLHTDIVVMITPDAYATSKEMIEELVKPITSGDAEVSYARQIPHDDADLFASFARNYNYPNESHLRTLADVNKWGVYTYFCSNSCAAYLNKALDAVGGFPEVLIGEDTFATAKILQRGGRIAYVAEAIVKHSHSYTLKQEFKRSFDTGLARKMNEKLLEEGGNDEKRGRDYTKLLFNELINKEPSLLPYAILQTLSKYLGYKLGRLLVNAPLSIKKAFSSQDFYWKNKK